MSGRTMNMPERESRKRIRRRRKRRRPPHGAFPFRKEEGSAARRAGDPASARSFRRTCRSGHVHVHVRAEQGGLPASEQIWSGWTFVLSLPGDWMLSCTETRSAFRPAAAYTPMGRHSNPFPFSGKGFGGKSGRVLSLAVRDLSCIQTPARRRRRGKTSHNRIEKKCFSV